MDKWYRKARAYNQQREQQRRDVTRNTAGLHTRIPASARSQTCMVWLSSSASWYLLHGVAMKASLTIGGTCDDSQAAEARQASQTKAGRVPVAQQHLDPLRNASDFPLYPALTRNCAATRARSELRRVC